MNRLHAENNHDVKMQSTTRRARENMRVRTFIIAGKEFPLPANKVQFTAIEACSILKQVELSKITSVKQAIRDMMNYSNPSSN